MSAQAPADTPAAIYRRAFAIDALCFGAAPPDTKVPYLTEPKIAAIRTSGITALSMCVSTGLDKSIDDDFVAVKDVIVKWDAFVAAHADLFVKVTTADGLDAAKESGRIGFIYNFQDSEAYSGSIDRLRTFLDMGVRQVQLSHEHRNFMADDCRERTNTGLSRAGFRVVELLNERRALVDLSHVGEQSALDAILYSRRPSMVSHAGAFALCPHPRNVSDRNIRALADRGGFFGVYNQSGWLTSDPTVSMDHYLKHVAHVIKIGGEDLVGVGTDGDVVDMTAMRPDEAARHQKMFDRDVADFPALTWKIRHMRVPALSHPQRLLHLAEALQASGYKSGAIEKIIGGNYARVFKTVVGARS